MMTPLKIKRLHERAAIPSYATPGSAGLDLSAALEAPLELAPGARALIPTGIAIALPPGHEGQVRPRSGLAVKHGLTVLNAPGTVDEDYRGEVKVSLVNLGQEPVWIEPGMRVAQLVVAPVARVAVFEVDSLEETERGVGGFGHTGS
jgi:dUTP pyrophosphatase